MFWWAAEEMGQEANSSESKNMLSIYERRESERFSLYRWRQDWQKYLGCILTYSNDVIEDITASW